MFKQPNKINTGKLILVIFLNLAILFGVFTRQALAAPKQPASSVQLITQYFPLQYLPDDGSTFVTVMQIPFTTGKSGKVQVTNLMSFTMEGGAFGGLVTTTCNADLNGILLFSKTYKTNAGDVETDASATVTTNVNAGSNTISISCTSAGWPWVYIESKGTSLIIVE